MRLKDVLTMEERQIIEEYKESMHRAWTKKGVDKFQQKILDMLEEAKQDYFKGDR